MWIPGFNNAQFFLPISNVSSGKNPESKGIFLTMHFSSPHLTVLWMRGQLLIFYNLILWYLPYLVYRKVNCHPFFSVCELFLGVTWKVNTTFYCHLSLFWKGSHDNVSITFCMNHCGKAESSYHASNYFLKTLRGSFSNQIGYQIKYSTPLHVKFQLDGK